MPTRWRIISSILLAASLYGSTGGMTKPLVSAYRTVQPTTEGEIYVSRLAQAFVIRGTANQLLGKHEEATTFFRAVIDLEPLPSAYYLLAYQELYNGNQDTALILLLNALKRDSTFAPALELLGRTLFHQQRFAEALEAYQRLHRIQPSYHSTLLLGMLYEKTDPDSAIAMYETALWLYPDQPLVLRHLIAACNEQGDYERTWKYMQQYVALRPDDEQMIAAALSLALYHQRYDAAIDLLADAQFFLPASSFAAHFARTAQQLLEEKDSSRFTAPIIALLNLPDRYDHHWDIQFFRGALALKVGRDTVAKYLLTQALAIQDSPATRPLAVAALWQQYQRYNEAIAVLRRYFPRYPRDPSLALFLSDLYREQGQYDSALIYVRRAILQSPKNSLLWTQLGILQAQQGNRDEANRAYEYALQLDSTNAVAANNLAYSLAEQGKQLQRALVLAQRAIAIDSTNAAFLDTMGWIYYKLGHYTKAIYWLEKAVDQGPSAEILEHLGEVYFHLGYHRRAQRIWQRALSMDPTNRKLQQRLNMLKNTLEHRSGDHHDEE